MLKYTGGGFGGAIPNIPARDLLESEYEKYGGKDFLLKTNLYAEVLDEVETPAVLKANRQERENKKFVPQTEDKQE